VTVLTSEGNYIGQPDNCYVIVDGVIVVQRVGDTETW